MKDIIRYVCLFVTASGVVQGNCGGADGSGFC
jgi:hypothetical protein